MPSLTQPQSKAEARVRAVSLAVAALATAFLVWLVYAAAPATGAPDWVGKLPACDALCNAASALFASAGLAAILHGRRALHRALMLTALAWSAVFLAGYVLFHHFHGETRFQGLGWIRPVYFALLISHVGLSVLVLPLLLATLGFAGLGFFERHKRLARWTFPLWIYVSVSGVAVFFFLKLSGSY
jgi:putative membrane protein